MQTRKQTDSEILFEDYCRSRRFGCTTVPVEIGVRTPDYRVRTADLEIVCEITELTPNDVDVSVQAALEASGFAGSYELAGRRISIKARQKKQQLKTACGKHTPGVLVFFQPDGLGGEYLTWDSFEAAMFGMSIASCVRRRCPLGHNDHGLCGPNKGRYISAMARLVRYGHAPLYLEIYHNPFATVPIPYATFSNPLDQQFSKLQSEISGDWGWQKVPSS